MNSLMIRVGAVTMAAILLAQSTASAAGPLAFARNKATRVAHRIGHGFDRHIARPAHRVIGHHHR